MTGLRLVFGSGDRGRLASTESGGSRVGGLDQRLFVQRLQQRLALGTGTVDRGTANDLGGLAHRRGRHFLDGCGNRLLELLLVFFIDGGWRHGAGGRLAHHGRRQIGVVIFIIEGGRRRTTADFRLAGLIMVEFGLGTTATADHSHLTDAIAVEGVVVTIP